MHCTSCGEQNPPGARFCSKCGTAFFPPSPPAFQPQPQSVETPPPTKLIFFGILFAAISLVLLPPVFGGLSIYLGYRVKNAGQENIGIAIMIGGALCLIAGMIFGAVLSVFLLMHRHRP